jgi:hypothetical protein
LTRPRGGGPRSLVDRGDTVLMPAGPSRPTFLVGLLLPWVTLAAVTAATYPRLTRSSMPEVLGED